MTLFAILFITGFAVMLSSLAWSLYDRFNHAYVSLIVGAIIALFSLFLLPPPRFPNPYPAIPVEKYRAFLNSGYRFYVESNKVYAVKNEVVCLGPASNVVTQVEN